MSIGLKILIGFLIGSVFGLIMIAKTVKRQLKFLDNTALELIGLLIERYKKLISLLGVLKNYMNNEIPEIEILLLKLAGAVNKTYNGLDIPSFIKIENEINKTLEPIKQKMSGYPSIYENQDVENAVSEVVEAEAKIGSGINIYNNLLNQIKAFLDTFPISFVASLSGQKVEHSPFVISSVEEFDDNYIDEDDI